MSSNLKDFFTIKRGIIISILYSITLIVYFKWFYKPFELITSNLDMPEIVSINEMFKSMNREDMIFFCIISFFGVVIMSLFGTLIYEEIVLRTKPIIAINARLKSKESVMQRCTNNMGFSNAVYNYNLTFEVDKGEELSFGVIPKYYVTIMEGNKGILKYKQGRLKRFIGFDLTSID